MPKQQIDNDLKQAADVRASLDQQRKNMEGAVNKLPNTHADERQKLKQEQEKLARNCQPAEAGKLEKLFAAQAKGLKQRQSAELQLINAALDTSRRMEQSRPECSQKAMDLLKFAVDLNSSIGLSGKRRQERELSDVKQALAIRDSEERSEALKEIVEAQEHAANSLCRDSEVASAEIARRAALAENALQSENRDRLVAVIRDARTNEKLNGIFSAEMTQRLADEALCPGNKRLDHVDEIAATQRVKGEMAEHLAAVMAQAEIDRENKTRSVDRQLFFIEGNRIRDEQGKKISDGLIVWRDAEQRLQIWKALEVKSGPHAARELNWKIEKLTEKQDVELRKYALDLARDEVAKREALTAAQRQQETERIAREEESRLRSRQVQRESGQREQTTERLDLTERMYIGGQAHQVAVDKERRLQNIVRKVVTDEAIKKDTEAQRLGVTSPDLQAIAKAFVEELLRQEEKKNEN